MRLTARLGRFRSVLRSSTPLARTVKGVSGLLVFVAVTWWALRSVNGIAFDWKWVAVLLVVGSPMAVGILALEQHVSTRLADVVVAFRSSYRTSLAATGANYLPIPGAAIVRSAVRS